MNNDKLQPIYELMQKKSIESGKKLYERIPATLDEVKIAAEKIRKKYKGALDGLAKR